jgi:catecholate siderophore receptor
MQDQLMTSIGDAVRYVPGVTLHQGENNRDQVIIRGNSSSADFFLDGVRDDVQYYRDLYNLDRVEALKGPNAMIFGRGGGGGVINRVTKEAGFGPQREVGAQGGSFSNKRVTADFGQPLNDHLALRVNGLYESSGSFRHGVDLERSGVARHHFLPGQACRCRHRHLLRQSRRQPCAGERRPGLRHHRASLRRADPAQPDDLRRL